MIHHMRYNSALGEMLLAADEKALHGVWFYDQKYVPENFVETDKASRCDVLIETVSWLDNYFEGHTFYR